MKIENKILKHFYGKAYKDSFYDEDREELRVKFAQYRNKFGSRR